MSSISGVNAPSARGSFEVNENKIQQKVAETCGYASALIGLARKILELQALTKQDSRRSINSTKIIHLEATRDCADEQKKSGRTSRDLAATTTAIFVISLILPNQLDKDFARILADQSPRFGELFTSFTQARLTTRNADASVALTTLQSEMTKQTESQGQEVLQMLHALFELLKTSSHA